MLSNSERQESNLLFTFNKKRFHSKAFQLTSELSFILGLTVLGIILSLQGWRSRIPAFDMLTYFDNAYNLLHHGILPQYGDISSYGSFSPPGTSWLMALGMLIFKDPRLYEKVGSVLLHFGTLWGIFVLAKKLFGNWPAYFATLIYGLSAPGLDYVGSLWPIGHPFFYIWMLYFALLWAKHSEAKYLTLAGITWAIGMNVDMAIAPSLFILPAIWLFYRPSIFSKSLFLGIALSLLVWYPYLKFEAGRDFNDLRSQLGRQNIFPINYRSSWCNPDLMLEQSDSSSAKSILVSGQKSSSRTILPSWLEPFFSLEKRIAEGLLSNFNQATAIPRGNLVLLLVGLSSLLLLTIGDSLPRIKRQVSHDSTSQPVVLRIYQWMKIAFASPYREDRIDSGRLLAVSLSIPWLILILVAEPGRPERFTWLWSLQVLVVSVFTTYFLPSLQVPKIIAYMSQFLLLILILPVFNLPSRLDSWSKNGWAGQDGDKKQVVDYLASQVRAAGTDRASIGYLTFIYPFMVGYNVINPRYKVGAEFDLVFKYQYGISNTVQCAEGFSTQDEYRVVEIVPENGMWAPRDHFNILLDNDFKFLKQFGSYQVFKRQ